MHSYLKVFSSQGRHLLAAFRQINVSTFLPFFCFLTSKRAVLCLPAPFWALHFIECKASENKQLSSRACKGGCCALCLGDCAWMYRFGWWCPAGSQRVCAHPARQKIRLTQAVQQTSQSYFWNSTRGVERDKVMKILSRWINVAALTFVTCSEDGLGDPPGMWLFVEEGLFVSWEGPGRVWQAGSHMEVLDCLHFLR